MLVLVGVSVQVTTPSAFNRSDLLERETTIRPEWGSSPSMFCTSPARASCPQRKSTGRAASPACQPLRAQPTQQPSSGSCFHIFEFCGASEMTMGRFFFHMCLEHIDSREYGPTILRGLPSFDEVRLRSPDSLCKRIVGRVTKWRTQIHDLKVSSRLSPKKTAAELDALRVA